MPTVAIEVKSKHIKAGLRGNCGECPIALAIGEQTNFEATIDGSYIKLYEKRQHVHTTRTPYQAFLFVGKFDMGGPSAVSPIAFDLELPDTP